MSLIATRRCSLLQRSLRQGLRSMTVLSKESGEEYKKLNYNSRMKELDRPVSPHVTIYAFPITALSSITNRVTGCALSVGCAGLGAIELLGGAGTSVAVLQYLGNYSALIGAGTKFAVAFPVTYHYFGAIRHIMFDYYPETLTNEQCAKSSYALFGASTLISVGAMFL